MSHQLLQGTQVSTVLQKVHRKAVAQSMGGDILLNMGFLLIELQNLPESLTADSLTAHVYKQGLLIGEAIMPGRTFCI